MRQHGFSSSEPVNFRIRCHLCDFEEPADVKLYFRHLGPHLRNKETVICPFNSCAFKSSVNSSFSSHKSRYHNSNSLQDFKAELLLGPPTEHAEDNTHLADENCVDVQSDDNEYSDNERGNDIGEKIKGRLASLLLRMQAILHVSKSATQEIMNELTEISVLAGECSKNTVEAVLQ